MRKNLKRMISFAKDYYKILGVKKTDPQEAIKKNYIKLVKVNHPDRGGSQAKIQEINEAY